MGPADSQQIPRARSYSGTSSTRMHKFSRTGLSPTTAGHSKPLPLTHTYNTRGAGCLLQQRPTTPHTPPLPGITRIRFSLIHVRTPLLA
ncbi:hypothetical protein BT093_08275, partial [Corynebacterium diphtheriae]